MNDETKWFDCPICANGMELKLKVQEVECPECDEKLHLVDNGEKADPEERWELLNEDEWEDLEDKIEEEYLEENDPDNKKED